MKLGLIKVKIISEISKTMEQIEKCKHLQRSTSIYEAIGKLWRMYDPL